MKILVTGGAGFIGSALANHLVHLGHRVRVVDDLSSGDPSALEHAVAFTRPPEFRFLSPSCTLWNTTKSTLEAR
jgi:nucleoside-diphosphate-sugar epimerase